MDLLKDYGLKSTKTRSSIIRLLSKEAPLSAEQISDRLKNEKIKLSSIYRNLNIFEEENILIRSIGLDGISYYQLNNSHHKHQLVCTNCGRTIMIEECPLHEIEDNLEKATGFEIHAHSFEFSGLCKKCRV